MTISTTRADWFKRVLRGLGVALFWIAVWEGLYYLVAQDILIASPQDVAVRLAQLGGTAEFWQTAALSLLRVLVGYAAAVVIGVLFAVLTTSSGLAYHLLYPVINILRVTPVASFIILALVWVKAGSVPSLMAGIMVFPLVWANVSEGIRHTDRELLEMARVYRFGWRKTMRRVYVPGVLPYFITAATTGLGMAWKAGVAAEVLSVPAMAVGTHIYEAKRYIDTVDLFTWTLVVIVLSMVLEKLIVRLMRLAARRIAGSGAEVCN